MLFSMITPSIKTWLDEHHHPAKRHSAVVFGIEAHVCVLQTVRDLLAAEYNVIVVADGTSAQRPCDVKLAFNQMRSWGATVISSEACLFNLMHSASHEKFRQISALVKDRIEFPHTLDMM